jgi:hypothetical protein
MKTLPFFKLALGCLAAASFAACGGSPSPVIGLGARSQYSKLSGHANAKHATLLYVSEPATNLVAFYSYPALESKGELPHLRSAGGLCTDPRTGNIWVITSLISGGYKLSEFAHGGTKPLLTLSPLPGEIDACSVNPTNGDLAVAQVTDYDDPGGLFIFTSGSEKRVYYDDRNMFEYYFLCYDSIGNLYVDGYADLGGFRLDELPSGSKKLIDVTPAGLKVGLPGGVQFDGTNIAVGDQKRGVIYQISDGKVVGTTTLLQTCLVQQFTIVGSALIAPNYCHHKGNVLVYHYPAGGSPTRELSGVSSAFATTVSQ